MTKEISLSEISESKEVLKHIKIANELTKETGLEHGFIFCKPEDKIVVDKMCVGDECNIELGEEKCKKTDSIFHTHPGSPEQRASFIPENSAADLAVMTIKSFYGNKPVASCVSGDLTNYTRCDKANVRKDKKGKVTVEIADSLVGTIMQEREEGSVIHTPDDILFAIKHEFIEFNNETGKIEAKGRYKEHRKNSIKRFHEAEEKTA